MRRQLNYLNVVLTVNAVLISGLLWSQIAERPLIASEASAQGDTRRGRMKGPVSVPNAATQRLQMIQTLRETKRSIDNLKRSVESGDLKVQVTNLDDITIDVSP